MCVCVHLRRVSNVGKRPLTNVHSANSNWDKPTKSEFLPSLIVFGVFIPLPLNQQPTKQPRSQDLALSPFLMVFGVFISLPVTETESSGNVSVRDLSSPSPCAQKIRSVICPHICRHICPHICPHIRPAHRNDIIYLSPYLFPFCALHSSPA